MAGGNLTFPQQVVLDNTGAGSARLQAGSFAPAQSWCAINCIVDVTGSPSCTITADSIILDQAGGPQPQLGPVIFQAQQIVLVTITGGLPNSQVVLHTTGVWDDVLQNVQGAIATLSGGTIGSQQLVGTPFQESQATAVAPGATYTSPTYPMLGYNAVFLQSIVTVGALTAMPTVQLSWLDVNGNSIYQSNYQSQKIIDIIASWGQFFKFTVTNNDGAHTCNIANTVVPIASSPPRKADALTYKATATNEILGLHNTPCGSGSSISATSGAGLGWAGPASLYVDTGSGIVYFEPVLQPPPNCNISITYGPQGTGRTLLDIPTYCPQINGLPLDLPNQPMVLTFQNESGGSLTPSIGILAGYR